jgi:hypothetical protein
MEITKLILSLKLSGSLSKESIELPTLQQSEGIFNPKGQLLLLFDRKIANFLMI